MSQNTVVARPQVPVSISQTPDTERAMNGFTSVNGRTSSPKPHKRCAAEPAREEPSLPARKLLSDPALGGERLPNPHQPNGVTRDHNTSPRTNGTDKRKRSVGDFGDETISDGSNRSSGSPPTTLPNIHIQDLSPYNHSQQPVVEHAEEYWRGQSTGEQAEHLHTLAPIQHENDQHPNGIYASLPPIHKDESSGLITTNAGVQMDPKKRKRAFSNRTRPGCQTCRKRKKKCDEAKPECGNCTRGGFKCEGYKPRVSWPPEHKAKAREQPLAQAPPFSHSSRELKDFAANVRPCPTQRTEAPQHNESPPASSNMRSRTSALRDGQDRECSSCLALCRDQDHPTQPMRASHDRSMSSMGSSDMPSMHSEHPMSQPVPPSVMGQARQALHLTSQRDTPMASQMGLAQKRPPKESNERLRMISGKMYEHADFNLGIDRQICASLLHIFNSTCHQGLEPARKTLRDVIERNQPSMPGQTEVRVGTGTCVDAPFKCEYGYNIVIGDYVHIMSGCIISDPRSVVIGKGSVIGSDVKIMGKVHPYRSELRGAAMKSGMARGFEIHIGEGVYIGANTVIQPEESECDMGGKLVIGHRAYIRPGSIVYKSVPNGVIYGPRYYGDVVSTLPQMLPEEENLLQNRQVGTKI